MASAAPPPFSSPFLSAGPSIINQKTRPNSSLLRTKNRVNLKIQAAKLPAGVDLPKEQPTFEAPFLGFTATAEIWNSRACMIGLVGTFILELILNKGILQIVGVDVGKGLDLPL